MDDSPYEPAEQVSSDLVALCERQFARVAGIGVERHGIDADEAERMAFEVFIGLLVGGEEIVDRERWLAGAMNCACREWVARHAEDGRVREGS